MRKQKIQKEDFSVNISSAERDLETGNVQDFNKLNVNENDPLNLENLPYTLKKHQNILKNICIDPTNVGLEIAKSALDGNIDDFKRILKGPFLNYVNKFLVILSYNYSCQFAFDISKLNNQLPSK